jgi:hypothetical protein
MGPKEVSADAICPSKYHNFDLFGSQLRPELTIQHRYTRNESTPE